MAARCLAVVLGVCVALAAAMPLDNGYHFHVHTNRVTGEKMNVRCGTQEVYEWRVRNNLTAAKENAANCEVTNCDDPDVRDATPIDPVKVRVAFTVVNDQMTSTELDASIKAFQASFMRYNIDMTVVDRQFVSDTTHGKCIPAFDTDLWDTAIDDLKTRHSVSPGTTLNVLITCQDPSKDGSALLGIGTFPWDSIALKATGGLWMNAIAMDPEDMTLEHETGHCLGLWHVFHGYDEVFGCNMGLFQCPKGCCEHPHERVNTTDAESNMVGDLCSDTSAQPRDYYCATPSGSICSDAWSKFGQVDYNNIMSYAQVNPSTGKLENCQDHFSQQQMRRMHCYVRSSVAPWICTGNDCN